MKNSGDDRVVANLEAFKVQKKSILENLNNLIHESCRALATLDNEENEFINTIASDSKTGMFKVNCDLTDKIHDMVVITHEILMDACTYCIPHSDNYSNCEKIDSCETFDLFEKLVDISGSKIYKDMIRKVDGRTPPRFYEKREFCKAMKCKRLETLNEEFESDRFGGVVLGKELCKSDCMYSAWQFHDWLQENGFNIVK